MTVVPAQEGLWCTDCCRAPGLGDTSRRVCEHQHFTLTLDYRAKRPQLTQALSGRREPEWYDFCYQGVSVYLCDQPTDQ